MLMKITYNFNKKQVTPTNERVIITILPAIAGPKKTALQILKLKPTAKIADPRPKLAPIPHPLSPHPHPTPPNQPHDLIPRSPAKIIDGETVPID